MTTRTFTFNDDNPIPKISFWTKEKFNIGSNEDKKKNRGNRLIKKNVMVIMRCNIATGSKIATAILNVFKEQQQGNEHHNTTWDEIKLLSCDGDVDVIHEILLQSSSSTNLVIADGRPPQPSFSPSGSSSSNNEKYRPLEHSSYWRALCQYLSNSSSSTCTLTTLKLFGMCFTEEAVKLLADACARQNSKNLKKRNDTNKVDGDDANENDNDDDNNNNNDNNICKIKELTLSSVSFANNSHMNLAIVIRRYISSSLLSFNMENPKSMSDHELSKFVSPILLAYHNDDGDRSSNINNMSCPSFVEEFGLTDIKNVGRETISVVTKWLRPPSLLSNSSTPTLHPSNHCRRRLRRLMICHPRSVSSSSLFYNQLHLNDDFFHALSQSRIEHIQFQFRNNTVSEEEFTKFIIALRECQPYLKALQLRSWNLSKYPTEMVSDLFKSIAGSDNNSDDGDNTSSLSNHRHPLTLLDLSGCCINGKCLCTLADQLRLMTNLQTLDLSRNQIFSNDSTTKYLLPALSLSSSDRHEPKQHQHELIYLENLIIQHYGNRHSSQQLQFITDLNRAGRRFLIRRSTSTNNNDNTTTRATNVAENNNSNKTSNDNSYPRRPATLWPYVFNRICHTMSLPPLHGNEVQYRRVIERYENESIEMNTRRRASLIYYFLLEGAMVDCLSERERQQ